MKIKRVIKGKTYEYERMNLLLPTDVYIEIKKQSNNSNKTIPQYLREKFMK